MTDRSTRPPRLHKGSPSYEQGRRYGVKSAIEWLHVEANRMNDPQARAILNSAAFGIGADLRPRGVKS